MNKAGQFGQFKYATESSMPLILRRVINLAHPPCPDGRKAPVLRCNRDRLRGGPTVNRYTESLE